MDQDPFTASLFKWDPRATLVAAPPPPPQQPPSRLLEVAAGAPTSLPPYLARGLLGMRECSGMQGSMGMIYGAGGGGGGGGGGAGGLEELFQAYGIRYYTAAKIAEMGFTVSTLVDMKEDELDDMMNSLSHLFRWELLVGERYGIKAAVRAERRRLEEIEESRRQRRHHHTGFSAATPSPDSSHHPLDALSQEGVQEKEVVGSGGGGGGNWEITAACGGGGTTTTTHHHIQHRKKYRKQQQGGKKLANGSQNHNNNINMTNGIRKLGHHQSGRQLLEVNHNISNGNNNEIVHQYNINDGVMEEEEEEEMEEVDDDDNHAGGGGLSRGGERQREHPFIVTEPGEVARGKKNGLDYLFHLYEQCREFLLQVQAIAKERGEKCPTKVTNQVFRYAKRAGATYINKPKMRHYVHCYALHCLDEETSNALRRAYKERGENVGAWRLACYTPLVAIAGRLHAWDIDAIFSSHPRLSIWYVPTKLRQLCHAERSSSTAASSSISGGGGGPDHLPF